MGDLVIVTGMSGVKPGLVFEKFNKILKNHDEKPVTVVDFEELLVNEALNDPVCKASPSFVGLLKVQEPIITVTSLPYPMLKKFWDRVIEKVGTQVKRALTGDQHVALVLHAVYFQAECTQFVPILDAHEIKELNPKCIVHFVDDIYDAYAWLCVGRGVHDKSISPGGKLDQLKQRIRGLVSTLVWRQAEAGASAHLAALLGSVPVFTVATKHRWQLLEQILNKKEITPVYLSHPISEPRREAARGNKKLFDDWCRWVGSLADYLSGELAVFEPTTIDEWRIQSVKVMELALHNTIDKNTSQKNALTSPDRHTNNSGLQIYLPRLSNRWPFGQVSEVLWSEPREPLGEPLDPVGFITDAEVRTIQGASSWEEIRSALGEKKSAELCCAAGELGALNSLIGEQINSRDRTLVRQCPNLVVYRPIFNGNGAGGVCNELRAHQTFVELNHYASGGKVFVLESSDDERLLWRNTVVELLCGDDKPWWHEYARKDGNRISKESATEIGDYVAQGQALSPTIIVERMATAVKDLKFQWGPKPGLLIGKGKGEAWNAFCESRTKELEEAFCEQTEYRKVLSKYPDGIVHTYKDTDIQKFAKEIVAILKGERQNHTGCVT